MGLLTRVVDDAQVATEARRSAERIAQGAPLAARINKRLSRRLAEGGPLSEDDYRDYFPTPRAATTRKACAPSWPARTPPLPETRQGEQRQSVRSPARRLPADRSKVALETPDLQYTWDDIDRATACMANLLASLRLPEGSRVAVQAEKSPEALLLYLATLRAGLVYLPLNTAYREAEIEYFLENAEPAVVVCSSKNREWVQRAADKAGCAHVHAG